MRLLTADVKTLTEAIGWLRGHCVGRAPETVGLRLAAGRVLARSVALVPSPCQPTAAIDGVAVLAAATEGASDYAPLPVAGVAVRAGDVMPAGADAVLPPHGYDCGAAVIAVGRGGNVHAPGHDVAPGAVLPEGTVLNALHLAVLPEAPLVRPLARVAVPGHVSLHAMVAAAGGIVVPDEPDLVLLAERPAGGTHWRDGIAMRPGETTAVGLVGAVPAIVLPRHPADAATVFALLAAPVLRRVAGLPDPLPVPAALTRKITSSLGQLDAVRVRVEGGQATPLGPAEGIGVLAAAAANGLVLVPEGSEGYPAGAMVPIYPL